MLPVICAAGLVFGAHGAQFQAREQALEEVWEKELDAPAVKQRMNPEKRVVNLLQKMRSELEQEAVKESEMYDKMVCWCETSEKEKTLAVQDAGARDVQLSSEIEERSARFGQLSASIEQTKQEIAANTESVNQATQVREKEASEFSQDEKDSVQAVTNLRNAVAVLSKHQSMLQLSEGLVAPMQVLLRDCALKYELAVAGRAERRGARAQVLLALGSKAAGGGASAEGKEGTLLMRALDVHTKLTGADVFPLDLAERAVARAASPESRTFLQMFKRQPVSGSPASSAIFGVLSQMLEEFEAELTTSQKDEMKAQEDFKALAATKTEEIETGKRKLDDMQAQDAANAKALSDAKEDLDNTRKQRSSDVEFLRNLKLTCNDLDAQMEKRSKTRSAETLAVAEAITILTEDDNREMLAKSVSLLQVHSTSAAEQAARRNGAAAALRSAAGSPAFEADDLLSAWHGRSGHSLALCAGGPRGRLSTLAVAVQLDSFTKVKEMMDTMVAELKKQQTEEVAFKGYCGKELDETEKTSFDKNEHKKDLEAELGRLEALTTQLAEEIAAAKDEIAKTEVDIKQASQSREEENAEFQRVVADQRATQEILNKALMKLKDFYEKGIGKAVLAQKSVQTPPVQFNDFKTNAGASPVIGLIEQIIEDSKALEAECTAGETKAQADYQALVTDGNLAIKELQGAVTDKSKASAAAAEDRAQASADLTNTVGELESLAQYDADLHAECDFTLKNFDIRQAARLQEIEAIQQAKGILSGAGGQ